MKPSTSHHNKYLREARKAKGLTEVRVWLEPAIVEYLDDMECDSRAHAVRRILNREISK